MATEFPISSSQISKNKIESVKKKAFWNEIVKIERWVKKEEVMKDEAALVF